VLLLLQTHPQQHLVQQQQLGLCWEANEWQRW
jgi:hypothetical protein